MKSKTAITICFLTASFLSGQETATPEKSSDSKPVATSAVRYTEQGEKTIGFLAEPPANAEKKHAAIILVHEWWGLNDFIKQTAKDFAEQGYVALAVDLYDGEATTEPKEAMNLATGVRSDMDAAFANLKDAIAFLQKKDNVDAERMASIGWCFGGGWSYQIAKNNLGVKASVIYYGRFNPADDLAKMRAEIIGHFADKDRGISVDDVNEFQATLKTQGGDHEIYIYPNTQHGFASRPGENPNYVEDAANSAWKRTLKFLKDRL